MQIILKKYSLFLHVTEKWPYQKTYSLNMCSLKRCCFYKSRIIVIPTKRIRVKPSKYCFLSPPFPLLPQHRCVPVFVPHNHRVLLRPYINTVVCMVEIKRVFYCLLCKIEESLIFSVQNVTGYIRLSNKSRHLDMKHDIDIANTSQGRTIQRRCFV